MTMKFLDELTLIGLQMHADYLKKTGQITDYLLLQAEIDRMWELRKLNTLKVQSFAVRIDNNPICFDICLN